MTIEPAGPKLPLNGRPVEIISAAECDKGTHTAEKYEVAVGVGRRRRFARIELTIAVRVGKYGCSGNITIQCYPNDRIKLACYPCTHRLLYIRVVPGAEAPARQAVPRRR